jgi:hypothetical protein
LIFVILLTTIVSIQADPIDNSLDCLVNYLRGQNLDDDVFNKTAYTTEPLSDPCNRRIKSEFDSVFIEAHQTYEDKKEFKKQIDCFIDSIKNDDKFKKLLLKRKAVKSIKLSWKAKLNPKNWIAGKKKKALKAVESDINAIETENLFVCEYQKTFEGIFDSNLRNSDPESCVRKLLNLSILSNNRNSLSCEEILKIVKAIVFPNFQKKSVRKCIDESILMEDFVSQIFKVKASLSELNFQDIENEKKLFVESMMNLMRTVLTKCTKK